MFDPNDWQSVSLGDVTFESRERMGDNGELTQVFGVDRNVGLRLDAKYKSKDLRRYKILRPGMFAYNPMRLNIGSIGYCSKCDGTGLVSPDYVVFGCNDTEVDPEFFKYVVRGREWNRWTTWAGVGSVRVRIYYKELARMPLLLPPLRDQKTIADILDALDGKIELNRRMNETLESLARAIFKSWFVDFDPVRAKMDGRKQAGISPEIAGLFPDSFEHANGELLPSNWRVVQLEEAMDLIIDYRGKTPKKTMSGVPLVTAKIVKGGRIREFGEFIAEDDYDSWMRRGIPNAGDIVMTTEAPLGEIAQLDNRRVALAQRLITMRGKLGTLENTYLRFLMQSPGFQTDLVARSSGTTVVGIKQSELRKIGLALPPIEQQRAFTNHVVPMTSRMDRNWRESETLATLRDTLLPKLLSGELGVANLTFGK